jgi:predicted nucleotidyltransferase
MRLAREIAVRMAARHGDALLVGGVYGSTARGEATEWSDLNLLFVYRAGAAPTSRQLLVHGIVVDLRVVTETALEAELGGPGAAWPCWMGLLATLQPLAGDQAHLARWRALGLALEREAFLIGAARHLPGLVFASYGRIRSCGARRSPHDAPAAAVAVVYELVQALCLLNRRWLTCGYGAGLAQSYDFPLLPEGYASLAPRLLAARELDSIVTDAGALVAAYGRLLAREMMGVPNYQQVEQLPLP